jgi:hypothetical protein
MLQLKYTLYLICWAVLISFSCQSQHLYDHSYIENPNIKGSWLLPLTQLEKLQARSLTKTTENFQLLGAVKTVEQTTSYQKLEQKPQLTTYQFLKDKRLLSYVEDTAQAFINSNVIIEKYTYSQEDQSLNKIVYMDGTVGINSKRTVFFNDQGLIIKELYEQYQKKDWTYEEFKKNIFDYELFYNWNEKGDSVQLDYTYKTGKTHYVRHTDRSYTFKDNHINSTNFTDHDQLASLAMPTFSAIERKIKKNEKGNIKEYLIYDHTIQGSFNVHQKYTFEYDQKDRLTDSKLYTSGPKPEWQLKQHYITEYLEFDAQGNWLKKQVSKNSMHGVEIIFYNRIISYY